MLVLRQDDILGKNDSLSVAEKDNELEASSFFMPWLCFPEDSILITPFGEKRMFEVEVGDKILDLNNQWTSVYAFLHRQERVSGLYIRVEVDETRALHISPNHIIFRQKERKDPVEDVEANDLEVGDILHLENGTGLVTQLQSVIKRGAYSPATYSGSMLVDNVWVSCYATPQVGSSGGVFYSHGFNHRISIQPLRILARVAESIGSVLGYKELANSFFKPSEESLLWYVRPFMWLNSLL